MNQGAQFVRHFENMLALARLIAQGARNRDESRGAHYKPAFPGRDDAHWLRTTLARYKPGDVQYVRGFDYECAGKRVEVTDQVDTSLVKPRERKYEQAGAASATAKTGS
jgi:succinate dehydrogenase / fumarate reductase flavoprotein subunit